MSTLMENVLFHLAIIFFVLLWKWSHDETWLHAFLVWLLFNLCLYGPLLIMWFIIWKGGHLQPLL